MNDRFQKLQRAVPTLTRATTTALEDAGLPPERQCLIYALVAGMAVSHFYGQNAPLVQAGNREIIVADVDNPLGPLALDYGEDDDLSLETGWAHIWIVIRPGKGLDDYWFLDLAAVHVPKLAALNDLKCEIPGAPFLGAKDSIGLTKPYRLGQVRYTASEPLTNQLVEQLTTRHYEESMRMAGETWVRVRDGHGGIL